MSGRCGRYLWVIVSNYPPQVVKQHTEQNQSRGNQTRGEAIPAFPHGQKHYRNGEGTHECRHSSKGHVWDLVIDIRVANVVKLEVAIISNEPAHEGEQELSEWRMDIEKVCPLQVLHKRKL